MREVPQKRNSQQKRNNGDSFTRKMRVTKALAPSKNSESARRSYQTYAVFKAARQKVSLEVRGFLQLISHFVPGSSSPLRSGGRTA